MRRDKNLKFDILLSMNHIYRELKSLSMNQNFDNQYCVKFATIICCRRNIFTKFCKIFKIHVNRKCESNFDKIEICIMIFCKTNIEFEKMLFVFFCTTTNNKSSNLQLKHVVRTICTIEQTKQLYNRKFEKQLISQLLIEK